MNQPQLEAPGSKRRRPPSAARSQSRRPGAGIPAGSDETPVSPRGTCGSRAASALTLLSLAVLLPSAAAADRAYVTDSSSGTVSVIDTRTHEVVATVPVGPAPWHPTCTPDGRQVYVSSSGDSTLYAIDGKTQTVESTIDLSGLGLPGRPYGLAFTRDGKRLFVTVHDISNLSVGYFVVITLETGEVSLPKELPGGLSEKIVMAPNGHRAYTQRIDVIDVDSEEVIATIPGGAASTILVSPDSRELYGTDLRNDQVVVIDTESMTVTDTVPIGVGANGLVVSVIDARTLEEVKKIEVGIGPSMLAICRSTF